MRAIWNGSRLLSRDGNALTNPPEVIATLAGALPHAVLDGELFARSWGHTVSAVKRSAPTRGSGVGFHVFDVLAVSGAILAGLPLAERKRRLIQLLRPLEADSMVWLVPFDELGNSEPNHAAEGYRAEGYEGAMLKLASSAYYSGLRSDDWLKLKATVEVDAIAVTAEEGTGRLAGSLGAVVVSAGPQRFKVGTGFSDRDRRRLWTLHRAGKLAGVRLTITYQPDARIVGRFPRFVRVREDY